MIQRFSPHSYSIIYKRKEEGRFLPDFRSRLEVGEESPKMMKVMDEARKQTGIVFPADERFV
ncbi:hypothetical protein [Anoxybacillus sp. CHMUD]|uniref:hypothetical protein n=1 Tax=Anoxybacillus sp. CHMUD TaxID=2508870 RepID=UPI001491CBCF|nr:hypothetical protein [Anoxybacillus sp. CHMUD]